MPSWSDAMTMEQDLCRQWLQLRERLQAKRLLQAEAASLSLRIPASDMSSAPRSASRKASCLNRPRVTEHRSPAEEHRACR
jgi:hypothetical protein